MAFSLAEAYVEISERGVTSTVQKIATVGQRLTELKSAGQNLTNNVVAGLSTVGRLADAAIEARIGKNVKGIWQGISSPYVNAANDVFSQIASNAQLQSLVTRVGTAKATISSLATAAKNTVSQARQAPVSTAVSTVRSGFSMAGQLADRAAEATVGKNIRGIWQDISAPYVAGANDVFAKLASNQQLGAMTRRVQAARGSISGMLTAINPHVRTAGNVIRGYGSDVGRVVMALGRLGGAAASAGGGGLASGWRSSSAAMSSWGSALAAATGTASRGVGAFASATISRLGQVQSAATGTLNSFRNFGGRIASSIGSMPNMLGTFAGSMAGNLAATGLQSLMASATGVTGRMFQMAGSLEQSRIAFETMLGSAEQANTLLAEIRKYSGESPLSVSAVTEGVTLLVNYGRAAGDAMAEVKMLGDIALGNEEKMKRLSLAYGQVAAKGRIMGGEVMQMVEAGFNPLTVIADMTGDSMTELQKKMEAGQLPFELLRQAVQKVTGEGGKFSGMTARMGTSFSGVMGQLSDTVDQTLGAIGTGLIDTFNLKGAALGLMEWIGPLQTQVPAALGAVKPYVDGVVSGMQSLVAQGSTVNNALTSTYELFAAAYDGGVSAFSAISDQVGRLSGVVSAVVPDMSAEINGFFSGAMQQAQFMLRDWDLAFQMGVQHVVIFGANGLIAVETFFTNAVRLASWFGGNFTDIMQTGANFVTTVFSNLATNIQSIWSAVWEAISTGSTAALSNIDFTPLTEGFKSTVKELPDFVSSEFLKSTAELDRLTSEAKLRQSNRTVAAAAAAANKPVNPAAGATQLATTPQTAAAAAAAASQKQMNPLQYSELNRTVQAAAKGNGPEKLAQEQLKQLQQQTQQGKQQTELLTKLTQGTGGTSRVVGVFG